MDSRRTTSSFRNTHLAMDPFKAHRARNSEPKSDSEPTRPELFDYSLPMDNNRNLIQFQDSFASLDSGTTCSSMETQCETQSRSLTDPEKPKTKQENSTLPDANNNETLASTSSEESLTGLFPNFEHKTVERPTLQRPRSRKMVRGIRSLRSSRNSDSERKCPNNVVRLRIPSKVERDQKYASFSNRRNASTPLQLLPEENFPSEKVSQQSVGSQKSPDSVLIDNATRSVARLFSNLKRLWLNVREGGTLPLLSFTGEHRLLELTSLCSFIVEEMEGEWRSAVTTPNNQENSAHLTRVEEMNRFLKDQVEHNREIESGLKSEISYMQKEKVIMVAEIRELSLELAKLNMQRSSSSIDNLRAITLNRYGNAEGSEEVKDQEAKDHVTSSDSAIALPFPNDDNIQRRENDFDSIMDIVVNNRGPDLSFYKSQLDRYEQDLSVLQQELEVTSRQMQELQIGNEVLNEKQAILTRERDHYSSVLKLILQEKQSDEVCLHDLLQTLISKLTPSTIPKSLPVVESSLLESAIQAVQEQNANYREEIGRLKAELKRSEERIRSLQTEWEASKSQLTQEIEHLLKVLTEKNEEIRKAEKFFPLQDANVALTQSKARLEKVLTDKETELKNVQDGVQTLQKTNLRQLKKCHEWQRLNSRLQTEIQEHKNNMECLNKIILQLRESLKEQDAQWRERFRASGDEIAQAKEHGKWFQTQVENMNAQLAEAHERMKAHERDKFCLAQQVLEAQEERKLVDRKLMDLRSALQGDTVLREALMERNEALQIEINRLRKAKLLSLGGSGFNEDGEFHSNPPSEMSALEALSSLNALPPSEKFGLKKNRYTAVYAAGPKREENPRVVASMHAAARATQRNDK